jgi:protein-tyrosine phosphatase
VPDQAAIRPTLDRLAEQLRQGRHVATHCRASIGRSSLLTAELLVRLGVPVEQAWDLIAGARGVPVPETDEQRRWPAEHCR